MSKPNFKAARYRVTLDDTVYFLNRGPSGYAKWYVLSESGKYLSKGFNTMEAASSMARIIHAKSKEI